MGPSPPRAETTPSRSFREIWRRFWPHARPQWPLLAATLALLLLAPLLEGAAIWLFKLVVDEVLTPRDLHAFLWIAPLYLAITAVGAVASGLDTLLSARVTERFLLSLRTSLFSHLQTLSLEVSERRRLGDTLSRLSSDIGAIEALMLSGAADAIAHVARLAIFGSLLVYLRWDLALMALAVAPAFWAAGRYFSRRIKDASRAQRAAAGSIVATAEEALASTQLVQAYNAEHVALDRFHRAGTAGLDASMRAARARAVFGPVVDSLEVVGAILVIGLGTWELSRGAMTLGGLLAFLTYLRGLYGPVRGLAGLMNTAAAAAASAERVIELMDERPQVTTREIGEPAAPATGRVVFRDVGFGYPGRDGAVLDGVSFTLAPGRVVALVGASGAGKSTVAKLLLRFYDPTSGSIQIDGRDIATLTPRDVRERVATVLQETLVLDGTIRENIAFGRPGVTGAEVEAAARAADAHGFIVGLPSGYDTPVGQRGRRLSGGQRQRVAIARAMVRDAPILVLDEPTTGLDADSADNVLGPLSRLVSGRATLLISHSLATVRYADEILVMEGGRVVERGTHDELLRHGGAYARMCLLQGAASPAGEPSPPLGRYRPRGRTIVERVQDRLVRQRTATRGSRR